MLLSDSQASAWGAVDEFYESVESAMGARSVFDLESDVWGKLQRKDMRPQVGDGIAFYHTTRARFPTPDPHRGRARISLIGEIRGITQDGQNVAWLSVRVRREDLQRLRHDPIIRDEKTSSLFEACGMVRGSVATFYEVTPEVWVKLCTMAGVTSDADAGDEEFAAFEGASRWAFVLHRKRESRLRAAKIAETIAASPDHRLHCEVPGCGFDFEHIYGENGRGYAEVHHLQPLSNNEGLELTTLRDLAVVCANCHRMIHRGGENRSLHDLVRRDASTAG
jgi:hypothetical protein